MKALQTVQNTRGIIVPADAVKDSKHRLGRFADWLSDTGRAWHKPDLAAYRDELLGRGLAPSSVSVHLSTVRGRYRKLTLNRDMFYSIAAEQTDNPLERKAIVDELVTRIENATTPAAAPVKVKVRQDRADSEHLRLTKGQADALLAAPGTDTLQGLRDTAIIGLMLCTGIRESELCGLNVSDLRQRLGGELALHVREGKGCKERLVPYGSLDWVLVVVDKWLTSAGITDGPAFRGLYKGGRKLRPGRLSVRAVQYIVGAYPVVVDGKLTHVRPHDLRRTYARRLYEADVDLVAIQQNLGHANLRTTQGYIGTLGVDKRRPPAVYSFDVSQL